MVSNFLTSRTETYGLKGRSLRWAVTFTAVTAFSLFGYDQGLMSGIITGPEFNSEFPPTEGESLHATVVQGAVVSCYELGCFFGAIFTLFYGERTGRRPLVIYGSILLIIGTVISTAAFGPKWGLGQFVVGRVISGLGNGMNTATVPVWQSEMSKAKNRGLLVNIEGAVIAFGTLIAYWIDFGFSYVTNSSQWRFPVAFQIVPAVVVLIGMLGLPESPRWLVAHKHEDEARVVLGALNNVDANDSQVDIEMRVMKDALEAAGKQAGILDAFTSGKTQHLRRMLIGASAQFFQQWTGCNAAIYFSTVLFETTLQQTRRMALVLGGVFAIVYTLSTIPSFFLIERIGRRKLFLIGAAGQCVAFTITFAALANDPGAKSNAKGAAVGLYLFIFFFAWTILPLPWVYPPEINPLKTRTVATSLSTCTNWISNFAVVMFTPIFARASSWGLYLFFALMNLSFIPIIYFFYPETAGRKLEEMDIIFAKAYVEKKPVYRVAQHMPKLTEAEIEEEAAKVGLSDEIIKSNHKTGELSPNEKDQESASQNGNARASSTSGSEQEQA